MKKSDNNYYIFLDVQTNRHLWDEKDNLEHYKSSTNPKYYTFESMTSVGHDSIAGLNMLISHARANLGKRPILVLCLQKAGGSRAKYFQEYTKNLKNGGLAECEIKDYAYPHTSAISTLGQAVSLWLYYADHGKQADDSTKLFARLHTKYALKKDNYVVITPSESNIQDYYTEKPYVKYENILTFEHTEKAFEPSMADAFIDLDCINKKITRLDEKNTAIPKEHTEILYGTEEEQQIALAEILANDQIDTEVEAYSEAVQAQIEQDQELER